MLRTCFKYLEATPPQVNENDWDLAVLTVRTLVLMHSISCTYGRSRANCSFGPPYRNESGGSMAIIQRDEGLCADVVTALHRFRP